jgi:hypothetical protein
MGTYREEFNIKGGNCGGPSIKLLLMWGANGDDGTQIYFQGVSDGGY